MSEQSLEPFKRAQTHLSIPNAKNSCINYITFIHTFYHHMKLTHTNSLQEILTNHNANVKKKVFIEKGEIPQLMMFGSATFKPGDKVETHLHKTMYEVFYIQTGKIDFIINEKKITAVAGDCITIEPNENHSQQNNYSEDVTWIYFGIATD
ncbi:hypothetical protein GCM10011397_21240 [Wenyingzhuangia marina]|nr:hypothetical protein GCM10011397_21240 [Wenyingzhuangia marina]